MRTTLLSVATVTSLMLGGFVLTAHAADGMKCEEGKMSKMCAQMCSMDDTAKNGTESGAVNSGGSSNMNSRVPGGPYTWGG
jgi:hypothetical protein